MHLLEDLDLEQLQGGRQLRQRCEPASLGQ